MVVVRTLSAHLFIETSVLRVWLYHSLCRMRCCLGSTWSSRSREYCQWDSFNASCHSRPHHVIVMTSARYGRMNAGRSLDRICILLCFFYCQLDAFCHHFNKVLMYVCIGHCAYLSTCALFSSFFFFSIMHIPQS